MWVAEREPEKKVLAIITQAEVIRWLWVRYVAWLWRRDSYG